MANIALAFANAIHHAADRDYSVADHNTIPPPIHHAPDYFREVTPWPTALPLNNSDDLQNIIVTHRIPS
jgi:hypothetical protein